MFFPSIFNCIINDFNFILGNLHNGRSTLKLAKMQNKLDQMILKEYGTNKVQDELIKNDQLVIKKLLYNQNY